MWMQICPSLFTFLSTVPNVSQHWVSLVQNLDDYGVIQALSPNPATIFVPTEGALVEMQERYGALVPIVSNVDRHESS